MAVKEVTDQTFEQETNEGIVVAELGASWCGPCKMLAPVLEEISEEDNQINVVELDIDDNPETTQKYDVMSVPTILFLKDGEVFNQLIGYQPKEEILSATEQSA